MVAVFSSCITQQKCNERYPPKESDSVITVTVYKDTTIYVPYEVPVKELLIHDTITKCPELEYHSEKHENGIDLKADIHKGIFNFSAKTDPIDTTAIAHVDIPETTIKDNKKEIVEVPPGKCIPGKWDSFLIVCGYLFWISWLLVAAFTAIRIYLKSTTGK